MPSRLPPPARLLVAVLWLALLGCAPAQQRAYAPDQVQHVVIAWLKEPGNAEHRRRLIEASRDLAAIPGVVRVAAGEPLPASRPVEDASYDVGVVLTFESRAALEAYQVHPQHKRAVAEVLQPLVRRIVVYDFVE
ncbi:MAG TPA: Dabb family protein [Pelomicrobium sp.]|nr:Dabb family protein [Pelomicrobium sp.]